MSDGTVPPATPEAERDAWLAPYSAVGVIGVQATEVAAHALRLAKLESQRRRVVIFNLLGDDVPLARLVADDDPHGVSDAVRFGVSLPHLARFLPGTPNVFVVPGGIESPLAADVLADRRWDHWIEEFRRSQDLLMVAAPADYGALAVLLDRLEGVATVGEVSWLPTRAPILRRIRLAHDTPAPRRRVAILPPPPRRRPAAKVLLGVGVLAAAATAWATRGFWGPSEASTPSSISRSASGSVVPAVSLVADGSEPVPWAVELASVNSAASAQLRVRQTVDSVPVPTYSPAGLGESSAPWYRLVVGAYAREASADSLLAALRDRGVVDAGAGRVIRAPYAWLLEDGVAADVADNQLFAWRQLGVPAYGLLGAGGRVRIYAGAFETEAEAQRFAPLLDSLDIHATLAPRVGSVR